jgi:hypothetical protein
MLFFVISCKKDDNASDAIKGEIKIDIGPNNLKFKFSKFIAPVDSIKLSFESKDLFNCNLYRYNALASSDNSNINIKIYNIYYTNGFCTYGNFPATYDYPIKPLQKGIYKLIIQKYDRTYNGTITVDNNKYKIDWQYQNILAIDEKEFLL